MGSINLSLVSFNYGREKLPQKFPSCHNFIEGGEDEGGSVGGGGGGRGEAGRGEEEIKEEEEGKGLGDEGRKRGVREERKEK